MADKERLPHVITPRQKDGGMPSVGTVFVPDVHDTGSKESRPPVNPNSPVYVDDGVDRFEVE